MELLFFFAPDRADYKTMPPLILHCRIGVGPTQVDAVGDRERDVSGFFRHFPNRSRLSVLIVEVSNAAWNFLRILIDAGAVLLYENYFTIFGDGDDVAPVARAQNIESMFA